MSATLALAFPLQGERVRLELDKNDEKGESVTIARLANGLPLGAAALVPDGKTLHISCLVIDEAHRGYGAGSEAARLILDAASAAGFARLTAWAPPDRGLATYFWHRMGLRAVPGPGPDGGILFERALP